MTMTIGAPTIGLADSRDPLPPIRGGQLARVIRAVTALAAALGLVFGLAWTGAAWERHRSFDGLKPAPYQEYDENIQVTDADREFSIGVGWLRHPGGDVEVLNVTAMTSANLEYLGASTLWPRERKAPNAVGPGAYLRGAKQRLHPITEVVPARETSWGEHGSPEAVPVVATFRLRSGDLGALNGLMMTYRVDGRTETEVLRSAAIVCVRPQRSKALLAGECPPPPGAPEHWFDHVLYRFGLLAKEDIGFRY